MSIKKLFKEKLFDRFGIDCNDINPNILDNIHNETDIDTELDTIQIKYDLDENINYNNIGGDWYV